MQRQGGRLREEARIERRLFLALKSSSLRMEAATPPLFIHPHS